MFHVCQTIRSVSRFLIHGPAACLFLAAMAVRGAQPEAPAGSIRARIDGASENEPLRTWKTGHAGGLRLVGELWKHADAPQARVTITAGGRTAWNRTLPAGDGIRHGFDVACPGLAADAMVEFRVTGNAAVETRFRMVREPFLTRWSPDQSAGYPRWADDEKHKLRNKGQELLHNIREASRSKRGKLAVPPGDYLFHARWSQQSTLRQLADLEIDATGATFWFEPPMIHGLLFEDCRNVTVRGLTVDFTLPCWFQARVTGIDRSAGTVTAALMPGYEPRDAEGNPETSGKRALMFYNAEGVFINHRHSPGTWSLSDDRATILCSKIGGSGIPSSLKPGDHVVGTLRTGAALRSIGCSGMRFDGVNIWSSPGMAVYEGGGAGGNAYQLVRATRRPATNRLHAFGADIFHLAGADRGPTLERCELAYGADDNLNIHGSFGRVVARENERRYFLDGAYAAGDVIEFRHERTLEPLGRTRVVSVRNTPDGPSLPISEKHEAKGGTLVELEQAFDLPALSLVVMDGRRSARGFVVRDCWLHDNFQRTLINGAPGGLIENNTLQNTGEGLIVQFETWGPWMEGPFARDLVIRGNRFLDSPPDRPAISVSMHPAGGGTDRRRIAARPVTNLRITGNTFGRTSATPLVIHNVEGLEIRGNSIDHPPDAAAHQGLANSPTPNWLYLQDCGNVTAADNLTPGPTPAR